MKYQIEVTKRFLRNLKLPQKRKRDLPRLAAIVERLACGLPLATKKQTFYSPFPDMRRT